MATRYPRNFGAMLNAFLPSWRPELETVDFQHFGTKLDPETGKTRRVQTSWVPCRSLKELIGTAQSWPITDNYITAQRYTRWQTAPSKDGMSEKIIASDHGAYILDRVYTDTDPGPGREDCLDLLPRFKKMQDELEVDGRTPVWIICSGRGYHTYTYLDRSITVKEGRLLQEILDYRFSLEADPHVPISQGRMMRLPYSRNSRADSWVVSVGRNMTLGGLRNAMKSDLLEDGCHWENPTSVAPARILALSPGSRMLAEARRKNRERTKVSC